jgi:hypothetical protein
LTPSSFDILSSLLPLILFPLVSPQINYFHISISLQLFLSLISIDRESTTSVFFSLLHSNPQFLRVIPLFESFLKKDILSEHTDSIFLRNPHKKAWLNNNLSAQEVIWRESQQIDSQFILRLILRIIQKLCHGVNSRFQDFFRHQNTSCPQSTNPKMRLRVVEEFNPNNPDSMDFVKLFCDFTFSSSLMFCNKVLGMFN